MTATQTRPSTASHLSTETSSTTPAPHGDETRSADGPPKGTAVKESVQEGSLRSSQGRRSVTLQQEARGTLEENLKARLDERRSQRVDSN